jgi:hypothetical protein
MLPKKYVYLYLAASNPANSMIVKKKPERPGKFIIDERGNNNRVL